MGDGNMVMTNKKQIDTYQRILDRMGSCFDTFTFETIEEKDMLIELLTSHIEHLKRVTNYCEHWHGNSEWEDPRR